MLSPKLQILILALSSMLVLTGAEGGCGGTSTPEPEIERPVTQCPDQQPEPWEACELESDQRCPYGKITCCDPQGGEGGSIYSTSAQCSEGRWLIAMSMIRCRHGYWPNNCVPPTPEEAP
ncbi:MAG: hypothetical protein VYA34_09460 [Myxococcota bacterium]|nr:hypothetical protein [Myxococcota bacterium]